MKNSEESPSNMDVRSRTLRTLGFGAQVAIVLCLLILPTAVHMQEGAAEGQRTQDTRTGVEIAAQRARRSSIVFRPLFVSREREAERLDRQDAWRRYWDSERRRQGGAGYAQGQQGYQAHRG